ncbi:hypothetical protein OUZ56_022587 [Daphnia magna]|uniref:Uncharacterized protein n=1 Tax=Daphnia magna TaxID=35525 RepID=A0ABR0AWU8_9CRUS|nr:hypothetical protein OUZ56_022587 [Daphnia magna]
MQGAGDLMYPETEKCVKFCTGKLEISFTNHNTTGSGGATGITCQKGRDSFENTTLVLTVEWTEDVYRQGNVTHRSGSIAW